MNPLKDFSVDKKAIRTVGQGLRRPECILAERDGSLWVADSRGGAMHITASGEQTLVLPADTARAHATGQPEGQTDLVNGSLPNGLAFDTDGSLIIANIGTDRVEHLSRTGATRIVLENIDGKPLGKVNFVLRDSKGRLWVTISTQISPWPDAIRNNLADGYVILIDAKGPRIVADGLAFTNEVRLDRNEEYLYVSETTAKRVSRFRVGPDGSLGSRETYGPSQLGAGLIDGITFDAFGNLWCSMIFADRLVAIAPDGEVFELMDDGDVDATTQFEAAFASGDVVPSQIMNVCRGHIAPMLTSVTFGGPDLKTVYLGSLLGTTISCFTSPVAGLPMIHWQSEARSASSI